MHTATEICENAIGIAIAIHRELGPGLLESAYQRIVRDELSSIGYEVSSEVNLAMTYKGREYANSFRVDLLVERLVVIEVKSTERTAKVHSNQVLTYLRCLNLRHGLVLNFGMERAIDGIDRVTNFRATGDRSIASAVLDADLPRMP